MVNKNKKDNKEKLIFGFDVGLGSLGVAVRKGDDIVEAHSYIIDPDVGSTKDEADRRRAHRTNQAHRQREQWLEKVWKKNVGEESLLRGIHIKKTTDKNGKKVFKASKGDERLEREFPRKGDNTVYNSALLRIMLIEGKKLEHWQIYKALRSAIQRRGYDNDVPWLSGKNTKQSDDEEQKTLKEQRSDSDNQRNSLSKKYEKYRLPCYYDALQMGLWDPKKGIVSIRQNEKPQQARGFIMTRNEVRSELELLLKNAEKQVPALKGKTDYILYGDGADPKKREYKDIDKQPEYSFATKRQGVLAQKYPRFDNRMVRQCSQIPQLQRCRSNDPLYIRTNLLLQLKNIRYNFVGEKETHCLSPEHISYLFNKCESGWKKKLDKNEFKNKDDRAEKMATSFKFTASQLKKGVEKVCQEQRGVPVEVHLSGKILTDKASTGGRCAYSRPALVLLKELLLSGKEPKDFYKAIEVKNEIVVDERFKKYNLEKDDLEFLLNCGDYENFRPAQMSLAEEYENVEALIAECHDPVVQHRLAFLNNVIDALKKKYGKPTDVVFEFTRDGLAGEQDKREYTSKSNAGQKIREDAKDKLKKKGERINESTIEKMKLYEEQKRECVYTGERLSVAKLQDYHIDHIIPQGMKHKGPDAYWNKVLTTNKANEEKGERTPYEWMSANEWEAFQKRVEKISKIKKSILLAKTPGEIEELIERYKGLAITGWIARLSRDLVCLKFGWQPAEKGEERKVNVVSGGVVAKVRKYYKLDFILHDEEDLTEKEKENQNNILKNIVKKNRDDKRHHALDAMVISFLTEKEFVTQEVKRFNAIQEQMKKGKKAIGRYDGKKQTFFKFPGHIDKNAQGYFRNKLEESQMMPELMYRVRPKLLENPAGIRNNSNGKDVVVQRKDFYEAITTSGKLKGDGDIKIFDERIKSSFLKFKEQHNLKKGDEMTLEQKNEAIKFIKKDLRLKTDIKKVLCVVGEDVTQYKDLKKDTVGNVLGDQLFTNAQKTGEGVFRKGTFICEKNDKYELVPVHSFDNALEKKKSLEESGYTFEFDGRVIQKGNIFETDKGRLYLQKTSGNSIFLNTYDNQHINSNGEIVKPETKVSISAFMSWNPDLN